LLRPTDLYQEFIIVLSPEAIQSQMKSFLAYFGKERFLANLLLDERKEVQEIAIKYIDTGDWQGNILPEKEQAIKEIQDGFAPFLNHVLPFVHDDQSVYMYEEPLALQKKVEQLIADRNKLLKQLDEKEQVSKKYESLSKAVEKKLRKANSDNGKLEKALRDARRLFEIDKETLSSKNEIFKKAIDGKNNELLNQNRSFIRDDLLIKAEEALKKFVVASKYPLNEIVHSELCLIRTIDLIQCFYLLNPHNSQCSSETEEMLGKLIEKASAIRNNLGIEKEHSPLYHSTSKLIEKASFPDELVNICNSLYVLNELSVLSTDEISTLYVNYHSKMDQIYKQYISREAIVFEELTNFIWYFKKALRENLPFLVLLDAYNITREIKSIFSPYYEKGEPLGKARKHLLEIVGKIVKKSDKVEVKVYFDSPSSGTEHWSTNVNAIYSGIPGKHSADNAILGDLYHQQNDLTVPRCLVSNDEELTREAFQLGARIMSVQEFSALFRLQSVHF
jgi:hypothetical protein